MVQQGQAVLEGKITLPYRWALGPVNARFFEEFRNKRIMGTRCPRCSRVLVPARGFCSRCFRDLDQWVEVGDRGTLRTWVMINFPYEGQPKEPPYIIGVIELEGADTGFSHFVGGLDSYELQYVRERIRIGITVQAVWKEQRGGTIFDIDYFKPV